MANSWLRLSIAKHCKWDSSAEASKELEASDARISDRGRSR